MEDGVFLVVLRERGLLSETLLYPLVGEEGVDAPLLEDQSGVLADHRGILVTSLVESPEPFLVLQRRHLLHLVTSLSPLDGLQTLGVTLFLRVMLV